MVNTRLVNSSLNRELLVFFKDELKYLDKAHAEKKIVHGEFDALDYFNNNTKGNNERFQNIIDSLSFCRKRNFKSNSEKKAIIMTLENYGLLD